METSTDTAGLAQHMGRELLTGWAQSSRRAIRTGYGTGYREHVRPARGAIADAIRSAVAESIRADRETGRAREREDAAYYTSGPSRSRAPEDHGLGRWADRDVIIAVRPDYGRGRGAWTWTAYEDLRPQVEYELTVCAECAYLHTYGDDGQDYAERKFAAAIAHWGEQSGGPLSRVIIGETDESYAPIYTCDLCREESEGPGQHTAVILDR